MIHRLKTGSNRLMGQAIARAFPASFVIALVFNINGLVDSVLAGSLFSTVHIAAVGVATSAKLFAEALMMALIQGTVNCHAGLVGRGMRREGNKAISFGVYLVIGFGAVLAIVTALFAEPIVRVFGARTAELAAPAALYLRFCAVTYIPNALANLLYLTLNTYGCHGDALVANLIHLAVNLSLSVLFVKVFPGIGIGALGLGTGCASLAALGVCLLTVRRRKIKLELVRAKYKWYRLVRVFRLGIVSSLNLLIDGTVGALINHIIVASVLGTNGLAVFTVVRSFWILGTVAADGINYAVAPLFNLTYAARDKGALRQVLIESMRQGVLYALVWTALILLLNNPLIRLYGGDAAALHGVIRTGIFVTLVFLPCYTVNYMIAAFYDATESFLRSLALAAIPDSVLFPLLLWLLIPSCGYIGIWLALGGNTLLFFLLVYGIMCLRQRSLRVSFDRVLHLDGGDCARYPEIDVSIRYSDGDVSALSASIQAFLKQENASSRVAYVTALCMDELTTDIVTHARQYPPRHPDAAVMDVKMLADEKSFIIIIRSAAGRYNPLDFTLDPDDFSKVGVAMAQKAARKIRYSYLYGVNVISIEIDRDATGESDVYRKVASLLS